MLALNVVDRGFEILLGQTKVNKIGISYLSNKHCSIKENEQRLVGSKSG
jgi:hypothetical protein